MLRHHAHRNLLLLMPLLIIGCYANQSNQNQTANKTEKNLTSSSAAAKETKTTIKNSANANKDSDESTADSELKKDIQQSYRRSKVSRFDIDNAKFLINDVSLGLKDYIGASTPILQYQIPKDADYAEIIRCSTSANITTGVGTISLEDASLSQSSFTANVMRANDFFRAAEETDGCEVVSIGEIRSIFEDSYAPSENFIYLLRSCVANERLTDVDKLTNRNCTKQIALSNSISYQNTRKDGQIQYLRKMHACESKINNTFWAMRVLAEDMVQETNACEEREHKRAVDLKVKEAWIKIIAIAPDIAMELMSYGKTNPGKILTHYGKPTSLGRASDLMGLMGALGGMSFGETFNLLGTTSADMPRSCDRLQGLQMQMQTHISTLNNFFYGLAYYKNIADMYAQGIDVTDGNVPPAQSGFMFP